MRENQGYSISDAEELIQEILIPCSYSLKFDLQSWEGFALAGHYTSALELGHSIILLIKSNLGYHSYSLARGLIVTIADIRLLLRDKSHIKDIRLKFEEEVLRRLKSAQSDNPYLAGIAEMPERVSFIEVKEREVRQLRDEGAKPISDERKLAKADMPLEYEALYREFSKHAHGNLGALIARHARFEPGDAVYSLTGFNHGNAEEFVAMSTSVFELLRDISVEVHNKQESGSAEKILAHCLKF